MRGPGGCALHARHIHGLREADLDSRLSIRELDDREERPGVMFADMELIGIPHRIVIGERGLKEGNVEYQGRRDEKCQIIPLQSIIDFVESIVC